MNWESILERFKVFHGKPQSERGKYENDENEKTSIGSSLMHRNAAYVHTGNGYGIESERRIYSFVYAD